MNKYNILSRAEMKKVMGGSEAYDCEDWRSKEFLTCFSCCITVNSMEVCLKTTNCGSSPAAIIIQL